MKFNLSENLKLGMRLVKNYASVMTRWSLAGLGVGWGWTTLLLVYLSRQTPPGGWEKILPVVGIFGIAFPLLGLIPAHQIALISTLKLAFGESKTFLTRYFFDKFTDWLRGHERYAAIAAKAENVATAAQNFLDKMEKTPWLLRKLIQISFKKLGVLETFSKQLKINGTADLSPSVKVVVTDLEQRAVDALFEPNYWPAYLLYGLESVLAIAAMYFLK